MADANQCCGIFRLSSNRMFLQLQCPVLQRKPNRSNLDNAWTKKSNSGSWILELLLGKKNSWAVSRMRPRYSKQWVYFSADFCRFKIQTFARSGWFGLCCRPGPLQTCPLKRWLSRYTTIRMPWKSSKASTMASILVNTHGAEARPNDRPQTEVLRGPTAKRRNRLKNRDTVCKYASLMSTEARWREAVTDFVYSMLNIWAQTKTLKGLDIQDRADCPFWFENCGQVGCSAPVDQCERNLIVVNPFKKVAIAHYKAIMPSVCV